MKASTIIQRLQALRGDPEVRILSGGSSDGGFLPVQEVRQWTKGSGNSAYIVRLSQVLQFPEDCPVVKRKVSKRRKRTR